MHIKTINYLFLYSVEGQVVYCFLISPFNMSQVRRSNRFKGKGEIKMKHIVILGGGFACII